MVEVYTEICNEKIYTLSYITFLAIKWRMVQEIKEHVCSFYQCHTFPKFEKKIKRSTAINYSHKTVQDTSNE